MSEVKTTENKVISKKKFFNVSPVVKYSIFAIIASILIGIFVMILAGQFYQIDNFFAYMFTSNFGSSAGFATFLGNLGWMILIGLSVGVAFKAGQFNIGAAGQMISGGMVSFMFASKAGMGEMGFVFTILIASIVGAFVAFIIAILKSKFNINVVISSIMINWIVFYLLKYLSSTEFGALTVLTDQLHNNSLRMSWLSNIFGVSIESSSINVGFIIALLLIPLFVFLYKKTTWGYKQDILGNNPKVATYIGINRDFEMIKTMVISGALAGLAGAVYYCGVLDRLPSTESLTDIPWQGFNGITIALVGLSSPIGILFSAILLTLLQTPYLDGIIGSMNITGVITATMILLLSTVQYFIVYKPRNSKKKKEKLQSIKVSSDKKPLEAKEEVNK